MAAEARSQQFMLSQQGVLTIATLKAWDIVIHRSMDRADEGNEE